MITFKGSMFSRKKENIYFNGVFIATVNLNIQGTFYVDCFNSAFEWFSDMMSGKTFDTIKELHEDVEFLFNQIKTSLGC